MGISEHFDIENYGWKFRIVITVDFSCIIFLGANCPDKPRPKYADTPWPKCVNSSCTHNG